MQQRNVSLLVQQVLIQLPCQTAWDVVACALKQSLSMEHLLYAISQDSTAIFYALDNQQHYAPQQALAILINGALAQQRSVSP